MITKEDEVECITEKPKFIRADKVKQTFQEILKEIEEEWKGLDLMAVNIIKSHIPPEWSKDEIQRRG